LQKNSTFYIFTCYHLQGSLQRNPDKKKEAIVKAFINDANILPLSPDVVTQCVKIRRSKKVKTPDAIIAATAIVHNLTLISSDSDFNNIQELKIIDPLKV
jgi:predicted nucleic acid-binding protein